MCLSEDSFSVDTGIGRGSEEVEIICEIFRQ